MFDINKLKSISKSTMNTVSSTKKEKYSKDERFWSLERDAKTGNGSALIRFLPSLVEDKLPWVQTYEYFLQGKNGWYVEKSRRTLGENDPMREYIHSLWGNAKTEADKKYLREHFRENMRYVANIYVIKDPAHPENEGKVKLFKFGSKIYDKIINKMNDEFGDSCNVFDWTEGANFKLIAKTQEKFPNYDSSEFAQAGSFCGKGAEADKKIVEIANQMFDLGEFVDPKNFKSYDELKARVEKVYGTEEQTHAQHAQSATRPTENRNAFGVNENETVGGVEMDDDDDFDELFKDA